MLVKVNGSKYWRLKYRHGGKQKTLALGVYPEVSLKQAREKVLEAKRLLAEGADPAETHTKQAKKRETEAEEGLLFAAMAKDWWENQRGTWTGFGAYILADVGPYPTIARWPLYDAWAITQIIFNLETSVGRQKAV